MAEQPKWLADRDADFEDLRAALEWGAKLDLKPDQRGALRKLCYAIAGEHQIPQYRYKEMAERARTAEARVAELERIIKASRDDYVNRHRPVSQVVSPRR
jgi:hypothetical protein